MKVSIITVARNAGDHLEQCIRSVINQDHPNIEHIIIDGLSTDRTLDIVAHYRSHISHFISEKDDGLYDALNKGIAIATGDVVGVLHSDDEFAAATVISTVVTMFEESMLDVICGDLDYCTRDDTSRIVRRWRSRKLYRRSAFRRGWMPAHPTFYIRARHYRLLGGYRTRYGSAADYELMLRYLYRHSLRAVHIDCVMVKMRAGGISNRHFNNRICAFRSDFRAIRDNKVSFPWLVVMLKPLRKVNQFLRRDIRINKNRSILRILRTFGRGFYWGK